MTTPGLRERKRAALERDLAQAAYALVEERGFAEVTVEDIVEAVGVSRRTFSNYYSCKEEAVAAVAVHRAAEGLLTWAPAPGEGELVPLVRALVTHQFTTGTLATIVSLVRLARDHPQFVPYLREAQWRLWAMAGMRVLDQLGASDPLQRAELTAVMGSVFAVLSDAVLPADGGSEPRLPQVRAAVEHVLDRLETGFGG